ncbi:hypothetical protein NQ315_010606 [Exocentrus adspersus]|uniref:Uncharacterized protein n=1 Tax=Exocentrus adspersus TaxID=1586481 RepID=A0AAV8W6C9_9CUCU|nr:hypothetical protein NQ315_010606 [Exocentrus adspersus]
MTMQILQSVSLFGITNYYQLENDICCFCKKWITPKRLNLGIGKLDKSLPKIIIAGHPLAQNERCLHMFLQEPQIDKNYVPGKIRNT